MKDCLLLVFWCGEELQESNELEVGLFELSFYPNKKEKT